MKIDVDEETYVVFNYYYDVWDNWNQFKILPHGRGTIHELPWVLDIIKFFNRVNEQIELFREKKRG